MPRQNREKRIDLLRSESDGYAFFLRSAYLTAELRLEAAKERIRVTRKIADNGDFSMRCCEGNWEGHTTSQFQQFDIVTTRDRDTLLDHGSDSRNRAKRTAI